jgi:nifR3 family TIM-barrel protein
MGLSLLKPIRIGPYVVEVPIILAPMAGVSEAPFRSMALAMGAGLAPTELVSAKGLEHLNARTQTYLKHDAKKEPLLSVQIFGGEPESMARAAEISVEHGAKIIDINMGCPVKKVTKTGAGSALMCDPRRAGDIVRAIHRRVGERVPVTAKIRAGWDDKSKNAPELGQILEDAGVAAVALHPRTRAQGYSGSADWTLIAELRRAVRIPVIANGDVQSVKDANRVLSETGADAVMIGRAALGNPWIFRALSAVHHGAAEPPVPSARERAETILAHLDAHIEHVGDELRAVRKFRQHLIWYSRGLRGGSQFRETATRIDDREGVFRAVEMFFARAEFADPTESAIYDERAALG